MTRMTAPPLVGVDVPEPGEIDDDEGARNRLARGFRRGGEHLARERLAVDNDGLPEAFEGHLLLQLREVDAAEAVEVQRTAFLRVAGALDESVRQEVLKCGPCRSKSAT